MKNKKGDLMQEGQSEIQTIYTNLSSEMSEERDFSGIGVKCVILVPYYKGSFSKEKNLLPLPR